MYFGYTFSPNLIYQGETINMEKSYTHFYNPNDTQIHLTNHIDEEVPAGNIMKDRNQNFYKGFNYKIYPCNPSKG